jgi:hypothetical protein
MNSLSYYTRQKQDWTNEELDQLKDEYETKRMTISQIGDIHRRTPGSISFKLKNLMLIKNSTEARGYSDYKNSNLYKEIVSNGECTRSEKKIKKEEKKEKITVASNIQSEEYLDLKRDIKDLKNKIDELLELMNAVYKFEVSEG